MLGLFQLGELTHISQKTQRILIKYGYKNMKDVGLNLDKVVAIEELSQYAIDEISEFITSVNKIYRKFQGGLTALFFMPN